MLNQENDKIYLAGPLFTLAEREFNLDLTNFLREKGYKVLLPQEFCQNFFTLREVFERCRNHIDDASVVLAILDGADADSGTSWEVGYAYAKDKCILGLRTDFRETGDAGSLNCMLEFSSHAILRINSLTANRKEMYSSFESALCKIFSEN